MPPGGVIRRPTAEPSHDVPQLAEAAQEAALSSARQASHIQTVVTRVAVVGGGFGVVAGGSGQPHAEDGRSSMPDVGTFKDSVAATKEQELAAQEYEQAVLAAQQPTAHDFGVDSLDVSLDG